MEGYIDPRLANSSPEELPGHADGLMALEEWHAATCVEDATRRFPPSRHCDGCFGTGQTVGYDEFDRLAWEPCSCTVTGAPVVSVSAPNDGCC